jgi:ubiquinone/menaquinone biosynthesis C-methylase UbiE
METVHAAAISRHPSVRTSVEHETLANTDNVYSVATMNCDWIARFYRRLEYLSFGGALQACRVMYVPEVAGCQRAIVCGDGDGRFLAELLRANRWICADFVDLSAGMATLAQRRVEAIGLEAVVRANFHVADVREFNPTDGAAYDLITAHFFLDCFDDAEATSVTRRLASFARPGATLLLSDFRIPPSGIAHYAAAAIIRGLYFAFRVATGLRVTRLPNYEDALEHAGFRKQRETLKLGGLLVASLWRRI